MCIVVRDRLQLQTHCGCSYIVNSAEYKRSLTVFATVLAILANCLLGSEIDSQLKHEK